MCAIGMCDGLATRTSRWPMQGDFRSQEIDGGHLAEPSQRDRRLRWEWTASGALNLLAGNPGLRRPDS